jgi:UDPglucose 6-dehydrogenase
VREVTDVNLAVLGAGYVGLTTALCLAHLGHQVSVFDTNSQRIDSLQRGVLPIFEPGLEDFLKAGLASGLLSFSHDLSSALTNKLVTFICVPTPQDEDGAADLTHVLEAVSTCSPFLVEGAILATKSTVPVGSAQRVEVALGRPDISVVSNPEFLREGSAVQDFLNPDRIVIGSRSQAAALVMTDLYAQIAGPVLTTSPESAELIKYASNAFLAIKLSFTNDIAALCEKTSGDITEVTLGMGLDKRISPEFLKAGPGWGGSCFPKDTRALISIADGFGLNMPLIEAALESNDRAHKRVADTIMRQLGGSLEGKNIAVWGIAFKANTDDTRESPALAVISRLRNRGAHVRAYDPVARYEDNSFELAVSALDAAKGADALVLITEWAEFAEIDPRRVKDVMAGDSVLDCRRVLNAGTWRQQFSDFRVMGSTQ